MIKSFFLWVIHSIAHLLGWNEGKVISWREKNEVYIGFECSCGKISGVNKIKFNNDEIKYGELE
jgi:hypothetical protein